MRLLESIINAEQAALPMDTQLKFLQIITPLITTNKEYTIHGKLLAKVDFIVSILKYQKVDVGC